MAEGYGFVSATTTEFYTVESSTQPVSGDVVVRQRQSRAAQYLESKGFGWLMETNEEEEEELPLL